MQDNNLASQKKLIFIHVPKCAGQTVISVLYEIFGMEKILKIWNPQFDGNVSAQGFSELDIDQILSHPCIAGHIHYDQVRKKLGIERLKEQYFTCALIRHPVDQVISLWNYINQHENLTDHDQVSQMSFEEFVVSFTGNQQCVFLCGKADGQYASEVVKEEYSLVETLEDFDHFILTVCEQYNHDLKYLEIQNESKKIISKNSLDREMIEFIKSKNSEDLILYQNIVSMNQSRKSSKKLTMMNLARYPVWMYRGKARDLKDEGKLTEAIALYEEAIQFYSDDANVFRELGIVQEQQGNIDGAITSYQKTIELNPQQEIWLYLSLGNLLNQQEKFDECITIYQTAIQMYPENEKLYSTLANVANRNGEINQAIKNYRHAIKINPQQPESVYFNLGRLYTEQEKYDQSISIYKAALKIYPKNEKIYQNLGRITEKKGEINQAIKNYRHAIEINPQQPEWVYCNVGRLYTKQEKYDQSISIYKAALKIYPEDEKIAQDLAIIAEKYGEIDETIKNYRHAIEINPQQPESVYLNLGRLYTEQEKYDQSISIYKAALKIYPKNEKIYQNLGRIAEKQGKIDEAIKNYRHAIEINSQQPKSIYLNLGRLYTKQEKYDQSISIYKAGLKIYPKNENIYQNLGRIAEKMGEIDEAIKNYRHAIEINPQQLELVYWNLGRLLTAQGKEDECIATYQAALKFEPKNEKIYQSLGKIARDKGDINLAIQNYKQAIELDPQQPDWVYLELGRLLTAEEQFDQAIAVLQASIEQYPNNAEAYRLLGVVQEKLGNIDGIIANYRKAISLEPDKQVWIYFGLGQLLTKQERFQEAIDVYQDADQIFPENPEVYRQLGKVQSQADQLDAAAESFQKAITLEPDKHLWVYLELGQLLTKQERFQEAIDVYQDADQIFPENVEVYRQLGRVQNQADQLDAAAESFQKAIALKPDKQLWVYFALGQLLNKQERFQEAIDVYQDADRIFPENPEVYRRLGKIQSQAGQLDAAAESFQKVIALEPDKDIWAYLELGQLLSKQERFEEAIAICQDADQIFPENPEVYRQLGSVQNQADQLDAAAESFRKAIALEPDKHLWVYFSLGQILKEQDDIDRAIALYEEAAKIFPDHATLQRELGFAQKKKGNVEAEIAAYQRCIALQPEQSHWVYFNLAYLLIQQGDIKTAISYYQQAVKVKPESVNPHFLQRAEFFFQQGDLDQALSAYQQAVMLSNEWNDETDEQFVAHHSLGTVPRICIVTPVFNGEDYIDETIYSIVTQAGNFSIRYHVQDGQSTDATLDKLKQWQRRIEKNQIPLLCQGIEFTFTSEPDKGMYDAINQAVANLNLGDNDYMTWINADDRLSHGALATVADVFTTFDRIHWLGGRTCLINEQGITTHLSIPRSFGRLAIKAGLHDGRNLPFIMQEGTFWRGWLWQKVKGVNNSLRLAGDYDLWKRFAEYANYVLVDAVLATHRKRPGQLSGEMDQYHHEVDTILNPPELATYEDTWQNFSYHKSDELEQLRQNFSGRVLHYSPGLQSWNYTPFPYTVHLSPSFVVSAAETQTAIAANFGKGFGIAQNSNPIKNLPDGIRWTEARNNDLEFEVEESGQYEITLICKTFDQVLVRLSQEEDVLLSQVLPITKHHSTCKILANAILTQGKNTITLGVTYKRDMRNIRAARIVVISCEAVLQSPLN